MAQIDGLAETVESAGIRVGPYRLIARLGAGGMGEVWRAHDDVLRRDVAVKVLKAARVGSSDARVRMLREARAQASLNHANVCTIFGAGEDDNGVWIAMERLPGPTLAELASKERIESGRIARWGMQIARALEAAHAIGLAHRDLKPSNAMLAADGGVKLLDFGLAKQIATGDDDTASPDEERSVQTEAGRVLGTPRYMSPEQAAGDVIGPPSDIFSLGVMLFELWAQRPPFIAATPIEVMALIIREDAPLLAEIAPDVPAELASLVRACLARSADARPTASEVADRLAPFADARSGSTSPPTPRKPSAMGLRSWLVVGGGLVAIAGAIGGALVLRSNAQIAPDAAPRRASDPTSAAAGAPSGAGSSGVPGGAGSSAVPGGAIAGSSTDASSAPAPADPHVIVASEPIDAAAFTRDGRALYFIADRRAWVSKDGAAPTTIPLPEEPISIACCRNDKLFVRFASSNVLVDPVTHELEPTEIGISDSPDGTFKTTMSLSEISMALADGVPQTIASASAEEVLSALRWSPDAKKVAWLRNSIGKVQLQIRDLHSGETRTLGSLGHASGGASNSLAWRDATHLVAIHHRGAESVLLEIDTSTQPTPRGRVLARWPNKTVDLLAIHGRSLALTESGIRFEIISGRIDGTQIAWAAPMPELTPPGVWARDGRIIAARRDPIAKTTDLVVASRDGRPKVLVPGTSDAFLAAGATTATAVLYTRFTATGDAGELWTTDFAGRPPTKLGAIGREDGIACGAAHCAILERTGTSARLRELDPVTGTRGKSLFETTINVGETKSIGASPDGDRFAVPDRNGVVVIDRKSGKQRRVVAEDSLHVLGADLTSDPAVVLVTDNHAPAGSSISRIRSKRTEVLATDALYFDLSTSSDDSQVVVTRQRTQGGLWTEQLPAP